MPNARFATLWCEAHGDEEQITAWAGGPSALELSRLERAAIDDAALRSLALAEPLAGASGERAARQDIDQQRRGSSLSSRSLA